MSVCDKSSLELFVACLFVFARNNRNWTCFSVLVMWIGLIHFSYRYIMLWYFMLRYISFLTSGWLDPLLFLMDLVSLLLGLCQVELLATVQLAKHGCLDLITAIVNFSQSPLFANSNFITTSFSSHWAHLTALWSFWPFDLLVTFELVWRYAW